MEERSSRPPRWPRRAARPAAATHPITATYSGATDFLGSTTAAALQQVVESAQTATGIFFSTTTLTTTVSQTPTLTVLFSGVVAPSYPTGTVTFMQGSTVLGTAPVQEVSDATVAELAVPQFASVYAIGTHTITATYGGDSTHLSSTTTTPLTLTVASPIFEDIGGGTDFVVLNSVTGAVGGDFFDGSSCGCNAQDYLAISPDGTRAYLLDPGSSSGQVHVINTATGGVLTTVSVPGGATDIAISPDGSHVYVGAESYPHNYIYVISTATDTVTSTITMTGPADSLLTSMAINPAGTVMYVVLQTGVAVVNLSTGATTAFVTLPGSEGIAVNPEAPEVYVTNGFKGGAPGSNTVTAISTTSNTIGRTYNGFTEPTNLAVNPAGTEVYVESVGGGTAPFVTALSPVVGSETQAGPNQR